MEGGASADGTKRAACAVATTPTLKPTTIITFVPARETPGLKAKGVKTATVRSMWRNSRVCRSPHNVCSVACVVLLPPQLQSAKEEGITQTALLPGVYEVHVTVPIGLRDGEQASVRLSTMCRVGPDVCSQMLPAMPSHEDDAFVRVDGGGCPTPCPIG